MDPRIDQAQSAALPIRAVFGLDFQEPDLARVVDALLFLSDANGRKMDDVDRGISAAFLERMSSNEKTFTEHLLSKGNHTVVWCCSCYTAEVARLRLGGEWAVRRKFFRPSKIGLEFKARARFVALADLCGSLSYLDLKSDLKGTPRGTTKLNG